MSISSPSFSKVLSMFKMASRSFDILPSTVRVISCILVGCLAMHFLLEDNIFFPNVTVTAQAAANGSLQLCDEADHKDDLVLPAGLPARISPDQVNAALAGPENYKKFASSPILPPPKA
jgi:hypothetical protein